VVSSAPQSIDKDALNRLYACSQIDAHLQCDKIARWHTCSAGVAVTRSLLIKTTGRKNRATLLAASMASAIRRGYTACVL
jgi:hypothetical protein